MGSMAVLRMLDIGFKKEEIGAFDSYMIVADILVIFSIGLIDLNKNLWKYYKLSNTVVFFAVKLWAKLAFCGRLAHHTTPQGR